MYFSFGRLATTLLFLGGPAAAKDWLSPEYKWLFQFPLPIPPVKNFKRTIKNPVTGKDIRYYEIDIKQFSQNVYPDRGNATLWGYDGISPGPTFVMERGTEAVVRFSNHARLANSVHLHGSYSRAPFDGWAEDITQPGQYKDYYYPNGQNARMLWYHDHAIDHTAENAYFGQAGAYILHDSAEDSLNLPKGKYDIPLVLASKQYNNDGSLFSPAAETTSLYGDVFHVNGQPWPYLKVEPRKYRFRFLDASISRSFFLYFERATKEGTKLPFDVIASDAGLLSGPQRVNDMYISMAERYEIVFDFAAYKGENLTLRNTRGFAADEDFKFTDRVMRFVVSNTPVTDDSSLPSVLRTIPYPKDTNKIDHHFKFERKNGHWEINGVVFSDVQNRVLAKPKRGTVEVWELENGGGGWSHPIHIHLIDFKTVKRVNGRGKVLPYESSGLKDVVWLGPGETVTVEAHYAPWDGVYMFHCHNLIHEDHEMMAAFNVTALEDLGYNETHYIDPMEPRWRSKPITTADFTDAAVKSRVEFMASFEPYDKVNEVNSRLDAYWATKTGGSSVPTGTLTSQATKTSNAAATTTTSDDKGGSSGSGKGGSSGSSGSGKGGSSGSGKGGNKLRLRGTGRS